MTTMTFESFKKQFGSRLAQLRKERGITQEQLARTMKMDTVSIAYIETAQRGPSFQTIFKLSKALKVQPDELFRF
ncbi:MAG: helix-turn-helix transcriptional regulator [Thermodesulfobacteriota bacterium]